MVAKNDLSRVLSEENAPATLLALLVVMAITLGYHQMRIGAGELLLPEQNHLVEWLMATPLATGRIVCGHVWGQLLQLCHAVALSSPLLLMAYSVSPAPLVGLLASLLAVCVVVLEIGLMAAIMVLLCGGRDAVRFFVRADCMLHCWRCRRCRCPAWECFKLSVAAWM